MRARLIKNITVAEQPSERKRRMPKVSTRLCQCGPYDALMRE